MGENNFFKLRLMLLLFVDVVILVFAFPSDYIFLNKIPKIVQKLTKLISYYSNYNFCLNISIR